MMEVVLDSAAVQHLLRSIRTSRLRRSAAAYGLIVTSIDKPLEQKRLTLAIDRCRALVDEWADTCGEETIKLLIIKWDGLGALNPVLPVRSIGHPASRRLSQMGFTDAIDRLIIRVALATSDPTVVSEDSDFWDPSNLQQKGNPRACVASLCSRHLGVTVLLLGQLLKRL